MIFDSSVELDTPHLEIRRDSITYVLDHPRRAGIDVVQVRVEVANLIRRLRYCSVSVRSAWATHHFTVDKPHRPNGWLLLVVVDISGMRAVRRKHGRHD
jgi:hypothetical protein